MRSASVSASTLPIVLVNGSCAAWTNTTLHQCEFPARLAGIGSAVDGRSKCTTRGKPALMTGTVCTPSVTHFVPGSAVPVWTLAV